MDRIIGGVLGLAAGIAVAGVSVLKGVALGACVLRASVAVVLGYWVGRLVFGKAGLAIVKEAAGPVPPPPSAADAADAPAKPVPPPPKTS